MDYHLVKRDLERVKIYLINSANAVGDKIHGHIDTLNYCIDYFGKFENIKEPTKSDALYDPTCSKCGDPLTTNDLVCNDCRRTA